MATVTDSDRAVILPMPAAWIMNAARVIHQEAFGSAPCEGDRIDRISMARCIEKYHDEARGQNCAKCTGVKR